jgi:DnaK suppressor protein
MREERIEAIRRRLLEVRETLLLDARHSTAEAAELIDDGVPDPGDMSIKDYLSDFLRQMGEGKREQILRIDDALQRIEEGTYGICQRCGEPIRIERLEVQPDAPHCVDCQEDIEREEIIRSGRPEMGKL